MFVTARWIGCNCVAKVLVVAASRAIGESFARQWKRRWFARCVVSACAGCENGTLRYKIARASRISFPCKRTAILIYSANKSYYKKKKNRTQTAHSRLSLSLLSLSYTYLPNIRKSKPLLRWICLRYLQCTFVCRQAMPKLLSLKVLKLARSTSCHLEQSLLLSSTCSLCCNLRLWATTRRCCTLRTNLLCPDNPSSTNTIRNSTPIPSEQCNSRTTSFLHHMFHIQLHKELLE